MRSIKRYTLPVGVVALLASCGGNTAQLPTEPALSMDRSLTERQERRTMVTLPMRGTWDNSESPPVANPPAGCLVKIETAQTGNATHLGRFTGEGSTCVTTQTPSESPPFWDHDPAPPYGVMDFENEMKWTAANGDELWLKPNSGVFVLSMASGAASVRGWLTIAGGTGRFTGATGRLEVTGGRSAGEPADHLEYDGEITMRPGAGAVR